MKPALLAWRRRHLYFGRNAWVDSGGCLGRGPVPGSATDCSSSRKGAARTNDQVPPMRLCRHLGGVVLLRRQSARLFAKARAVGPLYCARAESALEALGA